MRDKETIDYSHLNIKKIRNELIENLVKDEDYKKKDDKKKEIIKYCYNYKDFCNIVDCVNMNPIQTYIKKINYDEYINPKLRYCDLKAEKHKKMNIMNTISFIKQRKEECDSKESQILSIDAKEKNSNAIQYFIENLENYTENYTAFIQSKYDSDDISCLLSLISQNIPVLLNITNNNEPNKTMTEKQKEKKKFRLKCLISFLFSLADYWKNQQFYMLFSSEELSAIRNQCNLIISQIEKYNIQYSISHNKWLQQLKCIKDAFFQQMGEC